MNVKSNGEIFRSFFSQLDSKYHIRADQEAQDIANETWNFQQERINELELQLACALQKLSVWRQIAEK